MRSACKTFCMVYIERDTKMAFGVCFSLGVSEVLCSALESNYRSVLYRVYNCIYGNHVV
jgi:hypothetical protein